MKAKLYFSVLAIASGLMVFSACKKNETAAIDDDNTPLSTGAIAIGTVSSVFSSSIAGSGKDSLYVVNCHSKRSKRDTVAFAALPAAIGTYLGANYSGYTFKKAYQITDSTKTLSSYIVIIKFNSNPVGLKFTPAGAFVSVLEQRAGADLKGKGFHEGGPFGHRDGKCRDTVAVSAIPAMVKNFFTTTYAGDTLLHAYTTRDTTFILISKNKGLYATAITPAGKLVTRTQISPRPGKRVEIPAANLPAAIVSYLTATYPAYTLNKAFSASANGVVREYEVLITSNSTNYAVEFDAAGVFVKVKVLR